MKIPKINIGKRKLHISRRFKLTALAILTLFILLGTTTFTLVRAVNSWFDSHELVFNKVISVELKKPIEIKKREIETREIVKVIGEIPEPKDLETNAEKYIFEKFGIEDYKIAISIAKAESGLREDAININTNSTIDVGIFQINSIHFKKEFCTLKDVATMKGNVDCAYEIYKQQGWSPWVVWNTGSFKSVYGK